MGNELTRRVREGMPVLEFVARRIAKRVGGRVDLDDLVALGHPALLEVARTYDPSRSKFTTYAALKIKWAILDGLKRENARGCKTAARAAALAASARFGEATLALDSPLDALDLDKHPQADLSTLAALPTEDECQARLRALLDGHAAALALGLLALPDDEGATDDELETPEDSAAREELRRFVRSAVKRLPDREHALIERHYFGGEAFDVIARDLGISKSWASRLHAQAIRALAEALREPVGSDQ